MSSPFRHPATGPSDRDRHGTLVPAPPTDTPIDRLPTHRDLLTELTDRARPWRAVASPLAAEVTWGLWILWALATAFAGYLIAVRWGAAPCSGALCSVATLGDQPTLTLVLVGICAAVLGVVLPTRGVLSEVAGPRLAAVVVAVVSGACGLAGAAALVAGAAVCFAVAIGVVLYVVDHF